MANNVIIIGGGSKMDKFIDELEDRLISYINVYCRAIERVEVMDPQLKEIDPINMSFVGATVIPKLDTIKELWISRNRWSGSCIGEEKEIVESE